MFRKEDLKFGDIVTLRNKEQYIYIPDKLYLSEDDDIPLWDFTEDLENVANVLKYDIMKVERYIKTQTLDNKYDLKTLYERKEEILTPEELELLQRVLFLLRIEVIDVAKMKTRFNKKLETLVITYNVYLNEKVVDDIHFPPFVENTKFIKMKLNKAYTPQELGL